VKKSELRTLIRRILKEELSKIPAKSLQEAADQGSDQRRRTTITKAGSVEDLASNIFESDKFQKAFAADGSVFNRKSEDFVTDVVISKFPKLTDAEREETINQVIIELKKLTKNTDKDQDALDARATKEIKKIKDDNFDIFNNLY
jgi:hypothetical protein